MESKRFSSVKSYLMKNWDLSLLSIFILLFGIIRSFVNTKNIIVAILALLPLLIIPGYLIQVIIYTKKNEVRLYERLTIIVVFSIIFTAIIGFILGFISNINSYLYIWTIVGINIIFIFISFFRRIRNNDAIYPPLLTKQSFQKIMIYWKNSTILTKCLSILTIISLLGAFSATVYIIQFENISPFTTSFSITDETNKAVSQIISGVNISKNIYTTISNYEKTDMHYYLEVWLSNNEAEDIPSDYSGTEINLIFSFDIIVNKNDEQVNPIDISIGEIGKQTLFLILFKYEPVLINPTDLSHEEYVEEFYQSRLVKIITEDIEKNILGLWLDTLILPSNILDTGDTFNDNWFTSSEGWNWTISSTSTNYNGNRFNGYVDFYSKTNGSYIYMQTKAGRNIMYPISNHLFAEIIVKYTNTSNLYNAFGLSVDLTNQTPVKYIARLYSNTSHLIIGIFNGYQTPSGFYTLGIIPYVWNINETHILAIEVDFGKKWIAYYVDNTVIRNSTSDSNYIQNHNKITILLESKLIASSIHLMVDNFNATWIKDTSLNLTTPINLKSNYIIELVNRNICIIQKKIKNIKLMIYFIFK